MDTRFTSTDYINYISQISRRKGAKAAFAEIINLPEDVINNNPRISGMRDILKNCVEHEKKRDLILNQSLAASGLHMPIEGLFEMGIPRDQFIVKIDLTHGRLGDCLSQLATYIHAMKKLNLVLIINPLFAREKSVILTCSKDYSRHLEMLPLTPPLIKYLLTASRSLKFNRKLITTYSYQILEELFNSPDLQKIHSKLKGTAVVHVRAGDGLFSGGNMLLPPLKYYTNAIKQSQCREVIVVAEPFDPSRDPFESPVPKALEAYCHTERISCRVQSSEDIRKDALLLLLAEKVIASNSSFSRMLPIYGGVCKSLTIPGPRNKKAFWLQDASINYIDCWDGIDEKRWRSDLNYRIAWVSGH